MNRPVLHGAVHRDPVTHYGPALAVLSTVFFMWGFVTVLNDILIPHLKAIFNLNYAESSLIQFMFFSAYLLMSMPAAKVISWAGFHRSIVLGLSVVAAGALLFILAAGALSFSLFLGGHLKTGHTWPLQNRPTELNQNKSSYNPEMAVSASIFRSPA